MIQQRSRVKSAKVSTYKWTLLNETLEFCKQTTLPNTKDRRSKHMTRKQQNEKAFKSSGFILFLPSLKRVVYPESIHVFDSKVLCV